MKMTKSKELKEKIDHLSPGELHDLDVFINQLVRRGSGKRKTLSQRWAGELKEFRGEFTSVELQKKSLEWRKG